MPTRQIPLQSVKAVDVQTGLMDQYWYDFFNLGLAVTRPVTLTYGATVNTNAGVADNFIITVTNGTAFTIAAPTNATTGQTVTYMIRNASGGAIGAITWNAVFKINATAIAPANGTSNSIEFLYNGTNWVELFRSALDVPN
jgi:hypothetical protein